jgi:hypothetical protein
MAIRDRNIAKPRREYPLKWSGSSVQCREGWQSEGAEI